MRKRDKLNVIKESNERLERNYLMSKGLLTEGDTCDYKKGTVFQNGEYELTIENIPKFDGKTGEEFKELTFTVVNSSGQKNNMTCGDLSGLLSAGKWKVKGDESKGGSEYDKLYNELKSHRLFNSETIQGYMKQVETVKSNSGEEVAIHILGMVKSNLESMDRQQDEVGKAKQNVTNKEKDSSKNNNEVERLLSLAKEFLDKIPVMLDKEGMANFTGSDGTFGGEGKKKQFNDLLQQYLDNYKQYPEQSERLIKTLKDFGNGMKDYVKNIKG